VPRRKGRKRAVGARAPASRSSALHDQMATGRRFRGLNVVDDVMREHLAGRGLSGFTCMGGLLNIMPPWLWCKLGQDQYGALAWLWAPRGQRLHAKSSPRTHRQNHARQPRMAEYYTIKCRD
jgi:hypothetical protein